MTTEMLTYSRSKGVLAGLTLEGAVVQQDDVSTRAIYGRHMTFRNILSGKASTPESAERFVKAITDAGQQARIAEATEDKKEIGRPARRDFLLIRNRRPVVPDSGIRLSLESRHI